MLTIQKSFIPLFNGNLPITYMSPTALMTPTKSSKQLQTLKESGFHWFI